MSLMNILRPGDRVKFRKFYGLPSSSGSRSFADGWGKVMIVNRDSVVLDAGGRYGRAVVITADTPILKASRDGQPLIR